mgnify:FL=1|jgi:putative tricarboxylic transport membrane protein
MHLWDALLVDPVQFNDKVTGAFALVGGLAILAGTLEFREIPGQQFGSAFFPRIIGVAMMCCGAVMALRGAPGVLFRQSPMLRGAAGLRVIAIFIGIVLWIMLVPMAGFIATTAVLIGGLSLLAGASAIPAVATAGGISLLLSLLFSYVLRVPLPPGVVESVLPW